MNKLNTGSFKLHVPFLKISNMIKNDLNAYFLELLNFSKWEIFHCHRHFPINEV